ncbi:hypothetical protein ACEWY4_020906 [Coilia grayii]|uniref:C2H2-type domain-containing protein n=1 Tax=Coilia grayii TaxID=363190 RepID=A0ABD1JAV4_9TELE
MESLNSSNDKGNWCKRLRSRKGTARCSASGQADMTDTNSSHQEALSDHQISAPPSPKKQQNQQATDATERTPTPQCERSTTSSEPKTTREVHRASPPSAPPADVCDSLPSGPSSLQPTENHSGPPISTNGVFTCARCKFHSKDIVTFLQHTHNGKYELPLAEDTNDKRTSQSSDLHSYLSLASPGFPLKYEFDTQTPSQQDYAAKHTAAVARMRKERKYIWRRKEIQPKMEEDTSPELKLFLTKHPLKPNSWMARGFLSVEKEILDENGFLLNPEKTLEVTNKYLERRTIKAEKSGMKFAIKDELENSSRPATPASQPTPKNGTSLSSEPINPSNTELARLMERNNISIPPNCTTEVQGFKMVEGKKHLVLKVVPAAKQEPPDTVESAPSPSESIMSNTKTMPENGDQTDPASLVNELQECNGISAHGTASSCSSPLGVTDANCNPLEKPAHVQSEDQGVSDGQYQGGDDRHGLSQDGQPVSENGLETGDGVQISEQEAEKQQLPNEASPKSLAAVPASESTCGLLCEAGQPSEDEAPASADVNEECMSPAAAEGDSDSECNGGFPVSPSPSNTDSLPASPCRPCEEDGKEHSCADNATSIKHNGESRIPESNGADGSELSGKAEPVKSPPQGLDHSPQTTCPENSETLASVSSPDVTAQPYTELGTVQPPTCTQDAVESPGPLEPSPQNTEKAETNKRPRDSSPDSTEEGAPLSKLSRALDPQEEPPLSKLSRALDSEEEPPLSKLSTALDPEEPPVSKLSRALDSEDGAPVSKLSRALDPEEEPPVSKLSRALDPEEGGGGAPAVTSGCWGTSPRHVERTLRLFPFSWFQPVTKPEGDQPVVVLNHPDADIPEVANIMRVVHRHGRAVQRVVLCAGTLKALGDHKRDGPSPPGPSPSDGAPPTPPRGNERRNRNTVKERFLLKMKLRRSGQNAYQVVNADRQQSLRCWFCGRTFTKQEDFICHGQRHLLDANGDWNSWFKSQ